MITNEINAILANRYATAADEAYHALDRVLYTSEVQREQQAMATIDAMFRYFDDDLMADAIAYATRQLEANRASAKKLGRA